MTNEKVQEILKMLITLNEELRILPNEMLHNIDPRDNKSLEQGLQFIKTYNANVDQFSKAAGAVEAQLKEYFSIKPAEEKAAQGTTEGTLSSRIIKELNNQEPHTLDESFTHTQPHGFILGQAVYKGFETWRGLYIQALHELKERDPERFLRLLHEPRFNGRERRRWFSHTKGILRDPIRIEAQFYAEGNLSANRIRNYIKELLEYFGIDYQDMKIYLHEDRYAKY